MKELMKARGSSGNYSCLHLLTILFLSALLSPILSYDQVQLKDRDVIISRSLSFKKERNLSLKLSNRLVEEVKDKRKSVYLSFSSDSPAHVKAGTKYRSIGTGKVLDLLPSLGAPSTIWIIDTEDPLWKKVEETKEVFLNFKPDQEGINTTVQISIITTRNLHLDLNNSYNILTHGRKTLRVTTEFSVKDLEQKLKFYFSGQRIGLKTGSVAGIGAKGSAIPIDTFGEYRFILTKFEDTKVGHTIYKEDPHGCQGPRCQYTFLIKLKNIHSLEAGLFTSKSTELLNESYPCHDYLSTAYYQTYKFYPETTNTVVFTLRVAEGDASLYVNPGYDNKDYSKYMLSNKGKGVKRIVIEKWKLEAMQIKPESVSLLC